ncbi:hypothetical protein [Rheinheimera texasensis]|uniref:hypothetical protein n=1 Tax=Rheinheimera texasensis TaxID=306205 RepID=UPI0012FEB547|nr:hypothetical protein [Rheinheimera texasensis]
MQLKQSETPNTLCGDTTHQLKHGTGAGAGAGAGAGEKDSSRPEISNIKKPSVSPVLYIHHSDCG